VTSKYKLTGIRKLIKEKEVSES